VDGGIGPDTAPAAITAGASVLIAGTAVYGSPDGVEAAVASLLRAAHPVQRTS
jgi:ribulose-phosphate 3-epimerase